jgi:uncharacterized protein (TIGR00255 family)
MLKSMTAYGRATLNTKKGRFVAEIQSLNRKFQEISVQLPRELTYLETEVRKWVGAKVFRGKISLRITAAYEETLPLSVFPNLPLARQLKGAWEKIASDLQISDGRVTLEMLANEQGIILYNEEFVEEEYKSIMQEVVEQALASLIEMKTKEGTSIEEDFRFRLQSIKKSLEQIKGMSGNSTQKYRERLKKSIEEVLQGAVENEERIMREICVFAEKVDISEEITRLDSHLVQFTEYMEGERSDKGKTLEFILQEMNREANTIGAKSDDVQITKLVVEMKSEIERIREQVQNVE